MTLAKEQIEQSGLSCSMSSTIRAAVGPSKPVVQYTNTVFDLPLSVVDMTSPTPDFVAIRSLYPSLSPRRRHHE